MIVDALKTLSYSRLTKIAFVLFGTTLAPLMFIFQYAYHIFIQNSFLPLVFISICLGLPVALLLFILDVVDNKGLDPTDQNEKLEIRFEQMASSSIMCAITFYLPCCIKYLQPSLQLHQAVSFMAAFLFSFCVSRITSILRGGTKRLHDSIDQKVKKI